MKQAVIAAAAACALVPLWSAEVSAASVNDTWTEDATRDYFNGALRLSWPNKLGSWVDAGGRNQGTTAFAATLVRDTNAEKPVEWDVTALVKQHGADFFVRRSGGTTMNFHSSEAATAGERPQLIITRSTGTTTLQASADATLDSSTIRSLGTAATLASRYGFLLRFNQKADSGISKAVLRLTATTSQYGDQTLGIYRPAPRPVLPAALSLPLASAADVVLRVKGSGWKSNAMGAFKSDRMKINADGSLTVAIPTGGDLASDLGYAIPRSSRRETMFSRVIMKVHSDWDATMGGKYPGLSNTGMADRRSSNVCGWGSRVANGVCWSARTGRHWYAANDFAATHQSIHPYVYRYNRSTSYGEGAPLMLPIDKNKPVVLDQMVKLNTPGQANGEVAYWINGQLAGRMTGIAFRTRTGDDTLPSEYWLDVYEGGLGYKAKHPHTITFYEASVSTKLQPFSSTLLSNLN